MGRDISTTVVSRIAMKAPTMTRIVWRARSALDKWTD